MIIKSYQACYLSVLISVQNFIRGDIAILREFQTNGTFILKFIYNIMPVKNFLLEDQLYAERIMLLTEFIEIIRSVVENKCTRYDVTVVNIKTVILVLKTIKSSKDTYFFWSYS